MKSITQNGILNITYDLCNKCMEDFQVFMENEWCKIDSRKLVPCFNENNRIPANMISESNAILSLGVKALKELHDCDIEHFVLPSEEITERVLNR